MTEDYQGDRLIEVRLQKYVKNTKISLVVIGVLILLLFLYVLNLNIIFSQENNQQKTSVNQTLNSSMPASILPSPRISQIPSPSGNSVTINPTPASSPAISAIQAPSVKDYFVDLGSGTNMSSDWTDIPGAQVRMDFGNYPNIKEIHFEASIFIPTANETASVRLYNETDSHPVWYSNMTTSGAAITNLVSNPITYDKGLKTYQVQMQTQLQSPANLVQARIHIILK